MNVNAMVESLKEKVEQVIWDEKEKDVYSSVSALVIREMKYRIYPGVIWDLQAWARSKAEEYSKDELRVDDIILELKKNVADQDHNVSLQKLSKHYKEIAERYRIAARACND